MPPTIGGVGIDPQGQTVVVTITPSAKVYTDATGTTLATFPQTISGTTKWYVTAAQEFTVSALIDGVEAASGTGTTRVVNVEQGEMQVISVTVDHPGEESSHSHAYESAGGASATTQVLKQWTSAEAYELTALTRDSNDVVTSATVKWPDGSAGTFTAITVNATWNAVDAYTISHTLSGKTVTQAAVTRNASGAVTAKPALTVA